MNKLPSHLVSHIFSFLGPDSPESAQDAVKEIISSPSPELIRSVPTLLFLQAQAQLEQIKRSKGLLQIAYKQVCRSTPENPSLTFVQEVRNVALEKLRTAYAASPLKKLKEINAPHLHSYAFQPTGNQDTITWEEQRLETYRPEEEESDLEFIPQSFAKKVHTWQPQDQQAVSLLEIDQAYAKVKDLYKNQRNKIHKKASKYNLSNGQKLTYSTLETWNPIPSNLLDFPYLSNQALFQALYLACHRGSTEFVDLFFELRHSDWNAILKENPDRIRILLQKVCIAGHIDILKIFFKSPLVGAYLTRRSGDALYEHANEAIDADLDSLYELCVQSAIEYNHFEIARFLIGLFPAISKNLPVYLAIHPEAAQDPLFQSPQTFAALDWQPIFEHIEANAFFTDEQKKKLFLLMAQRVSNGS